MSTDEAWISAVGTPDRATRAAALTPSSPYTMYRSVCEEERAEPVIIDTPGGVIVCPPRTSRAVAFIRLWPGEQMVNHATS